jgi:hypothetical protein
MHFSSHSARKTIWAFAIVALSASSTLGWAANSNAQPSPSAPTRSAPSSAKPMKPTAGWKEFRSPAGKFAVAMPTKPKETEQGGNHTFQSSSTKELFILTYSDAEDAASAKKAMKAVPQSLAESLQAKIVRSQDISLRSNAGMEFDFVSNSDSKSKGTGRVYAVGKRLYVLLTSSEEQNSQRFFKSFRLL